MNRKSCQLILFSPSIMKKRGSSPHSRLGKCPFQQTLIDEGNSCFFPNVEGMWKSYNPYDRMCIFFLLKKKEKVKRGKL